ncbi:MAG TPA: glycoside hydrolase family 25 protein [Mycobacteriales bacterium]|nr:glycoside hydrolase family 25 protein [Mycobacteriales bacterium]
MPSTTRLRRTFIAAVALVVVAAAPALAALRGPDVSSWDHAAAIKWWAVRNSGSSFVFIKATEGTRYTNPYFTGDWRGSGAAGLIRGAYHFARPSSRAGSAVAQAHHFLRVVGARLHTQSLPPVLDLELSGGLSPRRLIAWTRTWLTTVQQATGRTPVIYSYPAFWWQQMRHTTAFRAYPLWGACYCSRPTRFAGAWTHWTFWQYSETSRVKGIRGEADMNRFNGTRAQLLALADQGLPVAPSPSPTSVSPSPTPSPTSATPTPTPTSTAAVAAAATPLD